LHGTYLSVERRLKRRWGEARWLGSRGARIALALLTYFLVCITWVFFRAERFRDALHLIHTMLLGGPDHLSLETPRTLTVLAITVGLLASHWYMRDTSLEDRWRALNWWSRSVVLATLILCLAFVSGDDRAFIYFQF
jgi:hypothetical protein